MGGTASMRIKYKDKKGVEHSEGYSSLDLNPVTCYYTTSYNLGSDFIDTPKTYGFAIYCPITLDMEIGRYDAKKKISEGRYCRPFSDYKVSVELHFSPSRRKGASLIKSPDPINKKLAASFTLNPASERYCVLCLVSVTSINSGSIFNGLGRFE